jgi:A nuclease family of the HNH/ENDO VII superfamily with conserved AHH
MKRQCWTGYWSLPAATWGRLTYPVGKTIKETVKAIKATLQQTPAPLLDQAIKETARQDTLNKIGANLKTELRRGRKRAQYALSKNMRNCSYHGAKLKDMVDHHLAASTDPRAARALRILHAFGIKPSDAVNGSRLPQYAKHTPHSSMPKAISHAETHTGYYHANVVAVLVFVDVPGATRDDIVDALRRIAQQLQAGTFPIHDAIRL